MNSKTDNHDLKYVLNQIGDELVQTVSVYTERAYLVLDGNTSRRIRKFCLEVKSVNTGVIIETLVNNFVRTLKSIRISVPTI